MRMGVAVVWTKKKKEVLLRCFRPRMQHGDIKDSLACGCFLCSRFRTIDSRMHHPYTVVAKKVAVMVVIRSIYTPQNTSISSNRPSVREERNIFNHSKINSSKKSC